MAATEGFDEKGSVLSNPDLALVGDEARPIDPEVERRVLRKIDFFLMPAMVIGTVKKKESWLFRFMNRTDD
jgi:hypothetical protein